MFTSVHPLYTTKVTSFEFSWVSKNDISGSWSDIPLWKKLADETNAKVPHTFEVHSCKRPTICQYCKILLKGLLPQEMQCRDRKYNCHEKCAKMVEKKCGGNFNFMRSMQLKSLWDEDNDHVGCIQDFIYTTEKLTNSHYKNALTMSSASSETFSNENDNQNNSIESQNIPLMRVVMSKQQMKPESVKVLKEGWMIHHTNRRCLVIFVKFVLYTNVTLWAKFLENSCADQNIHIPAQFHAFFEIFLAQKTLLALGYEGSNRLQRRDTDKKL
ncbi:unnamed protein product [Thelazia callipaeda]|uniref:Phorbol-ester/DAG-type domain-containing protein n=1 Tax=Thelazia callipaeda TaxID=103827 RepID=A0A0N5CR64_THECL|nr:unnamed protein product [Thelazia callipaeda]